MAEKVAAIMMGAPPPRRHRPGIHSRLESGDLSNLYPSTSNGGNLPPFDLVAINLAPLKCGNFF